MKSLKNTLKKHRILFSAVLIPLLFALGFYIERHLLCVVGRSVDFRPMTEIDWINGRFIGQIENDLGLEEDYVEVEVMLRKGYAELWFTDYGKNIGKENHIPFWPQKIHGTWHTTFTGWVIDIEKESPDIVDRIYLAKVSMLDEDGRQMLKSSNPFTYGNGYILYHMD